MDRYRGFTLIELLVVVAIIALLMAVLMPSLQRVRKQAKAVACQSNLHQWGLAFEMYTGQHNGRFWSGDIQRGGWEQYCWIYPLLPYHVSQEGLRFCPTATKRRDEGARDPFAAWGPVPQTQDDCSSYGMNNWVCDPAADVEFIHGREPTKDNWRQAYVDGAGRIPLFLDGAYVEGKPYDLDVPPEYDGDIATWGVSSQQVKRFCLNRHDGFVNALFLDFSVRRTGLKELWVLKWHAEFNTAGPWTKAGGVQAQDWPQWIRHLKDY